MKNSNFEIEFSQIRNVVKTTRLISDRGSELKSRGYEVQERRMGSGGVLNVITRESETLIQIGAGHGRYNYAYAAILNARQK